MRALSCSASRLPVSSMSRDLETGIHRSFCEEIPSGWARESRGFQKPSNIVVQGSHPQVTDDRGREAVQRVRAGPQRRLRNGAHTGCKQRKKKAFHEVLWLELLVRRACFSAYSIEREKNLCLRFGFRQGSLQCATGSKHGQHHTSRTWSSDRSGGFSGVGTKSPSFWSDLWNASDLDSIVFGGAIRGLVSLPIGGSHSVVVLPLVAIPRFSPGVFWTERDWMAVGSPGV